MLHPKQSAFLAAYSVTGSLTAAAKASKLSRGRHYEWMSIPEYTLAFDAAHQEACEALESECRHRAMAGVAEPVIYQGQLQYAALIDRKGQVRMTKQSSGKPTVDQWGEVHDGEPIPARPMRSQAPLVVYKKSDNLLMFMMKRLMPEYRESYKGKTGTTGKRYKFSGTMSDMLDLHHEIGDKDRVN